MTVLTSSFVNVCDFQPLEVVDRGSETQPQVVENLKKIVLSMQTSNVSDSDYLVPRDWNVFRDIRNTYVWRQAVKQGLHSPTKKA